MTLFSTLVVLLLESNGDGTVDNDQTHHDEAGADNQGVQLGVSDHFSSVFSCVLWSEFVPF